MVLYVLPRYLLPQTHAAGSMLDWRHVPRLLPVGPAAVGACERADATAHAHAYSDKWTTGEFSDAVCAIESANR
jgi:hypothetical protein